MADTKISDMTAASEVLNGDLVPIVNSLANFAATREQMLVGGTSEDIRLTASPGQSAYVENDVASCQDQWDSSGNRAIIFGGTFDVSLSSAASMVFNIDTIGNIIINCATNRQVQIGDPASCLLTMNGFGGNCGITGTSAHSISFFNPGSGDWATSDPADYQIAFNRLAALVRTLNGGTPIP